MSFIGYSFPRTHTELDFLDVESRLIVVTYEEGVKQFIFTDIQYDGPGFSKSSGGASIILFDGVVCGQNVYVIELPSAW
ncbi:hypothetical protein LshimejAT787_0301800 [Lyophyllum shimeji]|uniref:Uncharacterized protein n=1 Tax=Lyophyllum shimeji TaxID=47721 RepID=A0A9P3UJZ1_LYOSH|nr:hypothetical protein LshimejAT787_0301800 [Lyophyllum shimeji]